MRAPILLVAHPLSAPCVVSTVYVSMPMLPNPSVPSSMFSCTSHSFRFCCALAFQHACCFDATKLRVSYKDVIVCFKKPPSYLRALLRRPPFKWDALPHTVPLQNHRPNQIASCKSCGLKLR
eukprot:6190805-Pleurochrysis_carterae.AAC.2